MRLKGQPFRESFLARLCLARRCALLEKRNSHYAAGAKLLNSAVLDIRRINEMKVNKVACKALAAADKSSQN